MERMRTYKGGLGYSYTLGASPTYELIASRPEIVRAVYLHPGFTGAAELAALCRERDIPTAEDGRVFARIGGKENCYAAGVFDKYRDSLSPGEPHVVLVNPSDMGNMGTVIRTAASFFTPNLAVITPAADIFHPKTVRASMGALFKIKTEIFSSFGEYRERFPHHALFPFMLTGRELTVGSVPNPPLYSLIFGNEAAGLPPEYEKIGTPLKIKQSELTDSLNLSVAAAVGIFLFSSSRQAFFTAV